MLGKTDIRNYDKDEQDFKFAYHKDMEGLTDEEISDALRFYKEMKKELKEIKNKMKFNEDNKELKSVCSYKVKTCLKCHAKTDDKDEREFFVLNVVHLY